MLTLFVCFFSLAVILVSFFLVFSYLFLHRFGGIWRQFGVLMSFVCLFFHKLLEFSFIYVTKTNVQYEG